MLDRDLAPLRAPNALEARDGRAREEVVSDKRERESSLGGPMRGKSEGEEVGVGEAEVGEVEGLQEGRESREEGCERRGGRRRVT